MVHDLPSSAFLRVFAAGCVLIVGALAAPDTAQASQSVTCESDSNTRRTCRTNTAGGVTLQTQLSRASCHQGSTWGYDSRGIWVSNGCRAVFRTGNHSSSHSSSSDDNAAAAVAGLALLAVGAAVAHEKHEERERDRYDDEYYRYEPSRNDYHYYQNSGYRNEQVTCESHNDRYNYCRAPIHRSHVRLLRRHSDSGCTYDRDWGYDARGVWVENGCRATFEIE
jgi:hypothetical protein